MGGEHRNEKEPDGPPGADFLSPDKPDSKLPNLTSDNTENSNEILEDKKPFGEDSKAKENKSKAQYDGSTEQVSMDDIFLLNERSAEALLNDFAPDKTSIQRTLQLSKSEFLAGMPSLEETKEAKLGCDELQESESELEPESEVSDDRKNDKLLDLRFQTGRRKINTNRMKKVQFPITRKIPSNSGIFPANPPLSGTARKDKPILQTKRYKSPPPGIFDKKADSQVLSKGAALFKSFEYLIRKFINYHLRGNCSPEELHDYIQEAMKILSKQLLAKGLNNQVLLDVLENRVFQNLKKFRLQGATGTREKENFEPFEEVLAVRRPCEIFYVAFCFFSILESQLEWDEKDDADGFSSSELLRILETENLASDQEEDKRCDLQKVFQDCYEYTMASWDGTCPCDRTKKITEMLESIQYFLEEITGFIKGCNPQAETYYCFHESFQMIKEEVKETEGKNYDIYKAIYRLFKKPVLEMVKQGSSADEWSKVSHGQEYMIIIADSPRRLFFFFLRFLFLLLCHLQSVIKENHLLGFMSKISESLAEISVFSLYEKQSLTKLEDIFEHYQKYPLREEPNFKKNEPE